MTKEEAAAILGILPTSTIEEVRRRYQELHSDYQIRLTNAPTPMLRKAYQKNLQELREASQVLYPGLELTTASDLPTSQPVSTTSAATSAKKPADIRTGRTPPPEKGRESGVPRSALVGFVLAVAFAAAASFFFLKWTNLVELQEMLHGSVDDQIQSLKRLKVDTGSLKQSLSLLQNGWFVVCNQTSEKVTIDSLTVTYRDQDHYRTFNTAFHDYVTWDVQPGRRLKLSLKRGEDVIWDGSVLFYSMNLTYKGNDYLLAGVWNEVQGDCIALDFH
jgi:hypothetical protein